MKITMVSQASGKEHTMEINITPQQYDEYRFNPNRPHIQQMFPRLNPDEREFLMTGTTPQEWDKLFGDEK